MSNIDREILSHWKKLTESEKEEVLHRLQEKLTSCVTVKMKERALLWVR